MSDWKPAVHPCPQNIIRDHIHLLPEQDREFAEKLVEVADKNLDSVKQRTWLNRFADVVIYEQNRAKFRARKV